MKLKGSLIIGLIIISILILSGCTDQNTDEENDNKNDGQNQISYIDINASEARDLINNTLDLIIIDVSPNYNQGHIPGAVNYYIGDGSLDAAIPTLDKTKPYLVYCHVDSASIGGAQKLIDAGFTTVYRLEGNYQAWLEAGYPIE
jgi:rhodanese-related sulfurtransferase